MHIKRAFVLSLAVTFCACGGVDAPGLGEQSDGGGLTPVDAPLDAATTGLRMGEPHRFSAPDSGNAGVLIAQWANLTQPGTIESLSLYVARARGQVTLGVYDASGPGYGPGQLLATTAAFTPVKGWNKVNVTQPAQLEAGSFWLAYLPTSNSLTTVSATTDSSSGVYYAYGNHALPTTFSSSPSAVDYHWSFYATLTPATDGGGGSGGGGDTGGGGDGGTGGGTGGSGAFALGDVPFATSSSWNQPIAASTTYTAVNWPATTGYNYTVSWDSYSAAIYVAAATDAVVQVSYPPSWGYPGGTLNVRMPAAADGAPGTDGELLIIDGTTVHNFWIFHRTSATTATASAYGAADIMTGSGWGTSSPFLSAGITAAGSSQMAGILIQAETDAGEIKHALNLRGDGTLVAPGPVGQAISSDGPTNGGILREGQRYAIPHTTAMPSGLSTLGQKVFRALQNYGAYVTDVSGGCTTLGAQQNAYDDATMTALWHDSNAIIPLLEQVSQP